MPSTRITLAALAAALTLAGCGGDDEPASSQPSPAATATPEPTATATPEPEPTASAGELEGAGTDPVTAAAANDEVALLADVRAARHDGYDRVVFEFANAQPGHDVRYVDPPVRQDGSGKAVPVEGEAVLRIRMENALDADLSDPSAPMTYTGPGRFSPDTSVVAELARAGGFEGVLTWAAGMRERAAFRVTTLDAPPRLVVDVRHP